MSSLDLLKINVNDHTEKKNGLTYLSWAWAWAQALKADPTANFKVEMFVDNNAATIPFMRINDSCMVWVTVTMFEKSITCQLPVLDYRNKPIPMPNAFDVNTSIMRCLVKGLALHGLALYIYAGEDLPETDDSVAMQEEAPPKKIVKVSTPTATASVEINEADMKLFADSMIQFVSLCESEMDLKSYWKNNHPQIDVLKLHNPGLYADVLARFTEAKAQLTKKD